MDFGLSKQHILMQQMLQEFAVNEVKPLAADVDEEERFPEETVAKMQKIGLLGIPYPKEYKGQGGDYLAYVMAVEELQKFVLQQVLLFLHIHLYVVLQFMKTEQTNKKKNS